MAGGRGKAYKIMETRDNQRAEAYGGRGQKEIWIQMGNPGVMMLPDDVVRRGYMECVGLRHKE